MIVLNILLISNNVLRHEEMRHQYSNLPTSRCLAVTDIQAQAAIGEQHWELVIADLNMPHLTGPQLIDALTSINSGRVINGTHLVLIGKELPPIVEAIKAYAVRQGLFVTVIDSRFAMLTDIEQCVKARDSSSDIPVESKTSAIATFNKASPAECLEQIVAYYQPQFRVANGDLYGAEALARWDHPGLGILGPSQLLATLRSVKLREALWERMLNHAMRLLEQLYGTGLSIGVNVGADVANSVSWAENVARRFRLARINAEHLNIEITEDTSNRFDTGLAAAVSQLRLRGFDCAIDDFGIGFSSLQRLMLVPFSTLKIDKSFVSQARTSIVGHKILANTISMAHDLGLNVIAEGIETEEDFERIRRLGADVAQGYYFAQPMHEKDFINFAHTYFRSDKHITSSHQKKCSHELSGL